MPAVLLRENHTICRNTPVNTQIRIIPGNGTLTMRSIKIITLILKNDFLAQYTESMCQPTGNEKLTMIILRRTLLPHVVQM